MVIWPEVTGREKRRGREGLCRGLHFAFMEFHRGRVNQKFEGVYKRGDGERNGTERNDTRRKCANGTKTEERPAIVSLSALLTHHRVSRSRFLDTAISLRQIEVRGGAREKSQMATMV